MFPLVARFQVGAFHDAAPGETEHARTHVVQGLCQVLAHPVLMSHPGVDGEEGDVFQVHGTRARAVSRIGKEDTQFGLGDGAVRLHRERVFLPFLRVDDEVLADELLRLVHRVLVERAVFLQRDVAEDFPAHVVVGGKLKRAVLDEFGIQAAVGPEVDVFEERAVHGRLDVGPDFLSLYGYGIVLCVNRVRSCHECHACKQRVYFHDSIGLWLN